MNKVLVTGNKGYIGCVLVEMLWERQYVPIGFDTDFYEDCELFPSKAPLQQIKKDIRDIGPKDFEDIEAVIHLAALSNDPLGELDPRLTEEINLAATLKAARMAKAMGVRRFIYSSSQSMYGIARLDEELEEDKSDKRPLTAYARTKWEAECALKQMQSDDFVVVCFRPSTVFGVSPRLRCDIVFNNLVACAYTTGAIEIKSDGTPFRPVVHVRDVCAAYLAGLEAPDDLISGQSFNVGIHNGNYTVRDLAEAAQRAIPGSRLIFTGEHGSDARTYRVSFKKVLTVLKDYYRPQWDLDKGGKELVEFFNKVNFTKEHFTGKTCTRLKQIRYLMDQKYLDDDLRWMMVSNDRDPSLQEGSIRNLG